MAFTVSPERSMAVAITRSCSASLWTGARSINPIERLLISDSATTVRVKISAACKIEQSPFIELFARMQCPPDVSYPRNKKVAPKAA